MGARDIKMVDRLGAEEIRPDETAEKEEYLNQHAEKKKDKRYR